MTPVINPYGQLIPQSFYLGSVPSLPSDHPPSTRTNESQRVKFIQPECQGLPFLQSHNTVDITRAHARGSHICLRMGSKWNQMIKETFVGTIRIKANSE